MRPWRVAIISRITIVVAAFLGSSLSVPMAEAGTKQLFTQTDFKYLGAFSLPGSVPSGGDGTWGRTLGHRYVNGELHMLSVAWNPQSIYEVKAPAPSLTTPPPIATLVREWGDNWWSTAYNANNKKLLYGIFWDEQDKRLYWTYGDDYNTVTDDDPSVGYSTLNDSTGAASPVGVWRLTGRGQKAAMSCVVQIPQWFADAYTNGKRLGIGCGGYFSIIATGGVSMGPALAAIAPPNAPDRSSIAFTPLVGYPFSAGAYSTPERAHRDTNYNADPSEADWLGWSPKNGIGYFTSGDYLGQAAVWIDTPEKSALLYFPILSNGRVWYETSTIHGDATSHWWLMYDPADLAKVAQGQKQQWEIQPAAEWQVQYPGLPYPGPGWKDEPDFMIRGVTYDSTTRRVYIAVAHADTDHGKYALTKIYVYEVQSNAPSDSTAPGAPAALRSR